MKTMTCRQLAGACDLAFHAETFDDLAQQSRAHATQMAEAGDQDHIKKMEEMMKMMENPERMNEWFSNIKNQFEELPED